MMTRVMSRERHHRKEGHRARVHIYKDKISAGGNVVVASTAGGIGWSIGVGDSGRACSLICRVKRMA